MPEPATLEPAESVSRVELDEYASILGHVAGEARESPELVRSAPHNTAMRKLDEAALDDPARRATTWRAHLRKHGAVDAPEAV